MATIAVHNTENDFVIARLLSEEDEVGDSEYASFATLRWIDGVDRMELDDEEDTLADQSWEDTESDLDIAIAISLFEENDRQDLSGINLGEQEQQVSTSSHLAEDLASPPPACLICTEALPKSREGDEVLEKVFCPECITPFHNECLAQWFKEERETIDCPVCRREMDEDFVFEVINT